MKVFKEDNLWQFFLIFGVDGKSEVEKIWAMEGIVESDCLGTISIEEYVALRRQRALGATVFRRSS